MFDTLLTIGAIICFIIFTIAFQERNMMYKNYPTSCKVTYIPEKENTLIGPSNFNSLFQDIKTRENRKYELEKMIPSPGYPPLKLQQIILDRDEYTKKEIELNYSDSLNLNFDELSPEQLINIILDIESNEFKIDKSLGDNSNYHVLDNFWNKKI